MYRAATEGILIEYTLENIASKLLESLYERIEKKIRSGNVSRS